MLRVEQLWNVHPRKLDREIFAFRENWGNPQVNPLITVAGSPSTCRRESCYISIMFKLLEIRDNSAQCTWHEGLHGA